MGNVPYVAPTITPFIPVLTVTDEDVAVDLILACAMLQRFRLDAVADAVTMHNLKGTVETGRKVRTLRELANAATKALKAANDAYDAMRAAEQEDADEYDALASSRIESSACDN